MSCCFLFNSPRQKKFRKHCSNVLFPHVRQQLTNKMEEYHQQALKEIDAALAHRDHSNTSLVGLQGKIRAKNQQIATLQRRYVGYLSNEDKNNGISIITKNNEEAEYPYITIYGKNGYRSHKVRVLLARNQGSTLFSDGDAPHVIATYNFWREHRLIVVHSNRPKHFRLDIL